MTWRTCTWAHIDYRRPSMKFFFSTTFLVFLNSIMAFRKTQRCYHYLSFASIFSLFSFRCKIFFVLKVTQYIILIHISCFLKASSCSVPGVVHRFFPGGPDPLDPPLYFCALAISSNLSLWSILNLASLPFHTSLPVFSDVYEKHPAFKFTHLWLIANIYPV